MFFNSLEYFLFLPIVFLIFHFSGNKFRWLVLLLASFYFYAALKVPILLMVLIWVISVTYIFAILLYDSSTEYRKKVLYWTGVITNVILLLCLKYMSFITDNLSSLFNLLRLSVSVPVCKPIVTIGASFYIFQSISYLSDIYLGKLKPEKHLGYFALYMSFFPKLLQGPIERGGDLLPQLRNCYVFNYENLRIGMLMMAWGLFKKVVVADRLALFVNPVYDSVHSYSGIVLVVATYLYALQLYFEFSGYTDMALGSARLFNLNITQNFNNPYIATSIPDFWRRWHITFSRWIMDYVFMPLQMRMRDFKVVGTAIALICTFLLSGVWHGASWGFVVWGGMHGIYLASSVIWRPLQKKMYVKLHVNRIKILSFWNIAITFNLVCFAWIFFRANSITDAWYIVTHMFKGVKGVNSYLMSQNINELVITILLLILMAFIANHLKQINLYSYILSKNIYIRWCIYYLIVMSIITLGTFSDQSFIYFKF